MTKINIKIFLLITSITNIFSLANAQKCGEKIELFKTKFCSQEITSTPIFLLSKEVKYKHLLNSPTPMSYVDFLGTLGTYRLGENFEECFPLFSFNSKASSPIMDEVNMKYIDDILIPRFDLDPNLKKPEYKYEAFVKKFNDSKDYESKKKVIFDPQFVEMRELIFNEICHLNLQPFEISETTKTQLTLTFKTTIKAAVNEAKKQNPKLKLSAKLEVQIEDKLQRTAAKSIKFSGTYIESSFDREYVNRVAFVLSKHISEITSSKPADDIFLYNLKSYADPKAIYSLINSGVCGIRLIGVINKSEISTNTLSAALTAEFAGQVSPEVALSIATSFNVEFTKRVEKDFSEKLDKVYLIRYFTSSFIDDISFNSNIVNAYNTQIKMMNEPK